MMGQHTHLDLIAIQKHMLTQMGLSLWSKRTATPIKQAQSPIWQCRLTHPKTQLPIKPNGKSPQVHDIAKVVGDEQVLQTTFDVPVLPVRLPAKQNAVKDKHTTSQIQATKKDIQSPVHAMPNYLQGVAVSVASFELWGMRYRDWLLLADVKMMDTASRSVWQSLESALKKQDQKTLAMRTHYPLMSNDYPEYQHYQHGQSALLGFLLRLCAGEQANTNLRVGLLTPLSVGIVLGDFLTSHCVPTPLLDEMWQDVNAKKKLWQQLNQVHTNI